MKKPNFFIVGHPRCGTTSLYEMLVQHPNIFMPKEKEPYHFNEDIKQKRLSEKEYLDLFKESDNEKSIGEATPTYLCSKVAPKKVKEFNPNAKIIMILREPIDFLRAWYQKGIEGGKESISNIPKRIFDQEYIGMIQYSKQIGRYLDNFPKENIKIIVYDDYKNDNDRILKEIFEFLGVDNSFVPQKEKVNPSRFNRFGKLGLLVFKSNISKRFRKSIKKVMPKAFLNPMQEFYRKSIYKEGKIEIPEKTKEELKKELKPEVEKLNYLLHKEGLLSKDRDLVKEWGYRK